MPKVKNSNATFCMIFKQCENVPHIVLLALFLLNMHYRTCDRMEKNLLRVATTGYVKYPWLRNGIKVESFLVEKNLLE